MGLDLEDVLEAACPRGTPPRLVELARVVSASRGAERTLAWSSGRVLVTTGAGTVRLVRKSGVVGSRDGLTLTLDELRSLRRVCKDWCRRHTDWASLGFRSSVWGGGRHYYQPPGADTPEVKIGSQARGRLLSGEEVLGAEAFEPHPRPRRPARGVEEVGEFWWRGARQGPGDGSIVGVRYAALGLSIDARRNALRVTRAPDTHFWLESGDWALVRELVRLLARA